YDPTYRPNETDEYWFPQLECADPDIRDGIILHKLQQQVQYAWDHSSFYRKKWNEAGVSPATLKRLDAIIKCPVVHKAELRDVQAANPPFRNNLCIHASQVVRMPGSSGTTGNPTVFGIGAADWQRIAEAHACVMWGAGMRSSDRVMIGSFFSLYVGSW